MTKTGEMKTMISAQRYTKPKFTRLLAFVGLLWLIGYWLLTFVSSYVAAGLFNQLGFDFGMFWAATRAYVENGPVAAYDLNSITQFAKPLMAYYHNGNGPLHVGGAPYPPIAFALIWPFTLTSPPIGFALWSAVNAALVLTVIFGLMRRRSEFSWLVASTAFLALPIMDAVYVGQFVSIFVFSLYRAFLAWERGEDLRAGVWLSILVIKPPLAFAFVLVVLFKRRWECAAGLVAGGLAITLSSVLLLGKRGSESLIQLLTGGFAGYAQVDAATNPMRMISWRGELVRWLPGLDGSAGSALVFLVSLTTAALLVLLWRGPWNPHAPRFAYQLLGTVLVTLLSGYHVHLHSAALLIVPVLLVWNRTELSRGLRGLIVAGIYVPGVVNVLGLWLGARPGIFLDLFVGFLVLVLAGTVMHVHKPEINTAAIPSTVVPAPGLPGR